MRLAKLLLVAVVFQPFATASAVLVAQGDGTQNTTSPGATSGWNNVGLLNGSSGVYLGGQRVLTASHVGAGSITFPGFGTHAAEAGSAVRLRNADNSFTDLVVYRIQTDPGLPTLTLASTTPGIGTSVIMIGNGRNREAGLTYWDVTGTNPNFTWTEDPTPEGGEARGYKWAAGNAKRWGSNMTTDLNGAATGGETAVVNAKFGDVVSFGTRFDDLPNEGQAVGNDSGGAIFSATGELLGIMHAVGGFEDQPGETSVFGNLTYAADIATYRGAIVAAVPEPSAALLLAGACAGMSMRRRQPNR